ncbi:pirin family protein [Pseudomarimonas salicorniae]|uniref:Pirin family protein n=1 Tax=Pseudomarimonas salicorniae TaxID=2933270 RepID=A0ABT0GFV4_9GAMM|nr:pirin family protein [Lysobacter sp. CAU 1642]MCK7593425.1 pirin family protein [Lysobacter sp. CAU 1642]
MKRVVSIHAPPPMHWVGNGFPVRSVFSYQQLGRELSPFLLLDHAGPYDFAPAGQPRGVGVHPHRGFETVSIVYQGELEHRDSAGNSGALGAGDVQWMTAASGILHEEFHSRDFTGRGGTLEMVQLWVNLPAAKKMMRPGYQDIRGRDIPVVELPGGGRLRLIAGAFDGREGAARTQSPLEVWDIALPANGEARLSLPAGHSAALVVLRGRIEIDGHSAGRGELVRLSSEEDVLQLRASEEALVLVLGGEPLNEPIAGYGPFVMNSEAEIRQAMVDFQAGRFGRLEPVAVA